MQGSQAITSQTGGQRNQEILRGTRPIQGPQPRTNLTAASIAKAGAVILGTTATYYFAKATGIFSYLGEFTGNTPDSGAKSDHGVTTYYGNSLGIMEDRLKIIDHSSRPTVFQNGLRQKSKEASVQFEELDIESIAHKDFGGRSLLEVKDTEKIETHSVVNPIPDQNAIVGQPFNLVISGTNVFGTSVVLSPTGLPSWLSSGAATPTLKGMVITPGRALKVTVSGNYAYAAAETSGLLILDISNPANPTPTGLYNMPDQALGSHYQQHSPKKVVSDY